MQRPWPSYQRRDLKPLTQIKWARAAEWLKLARGGHLTYIYRHALHQRQVARVKARQGRLDRSQRAEAERTERDQLLTLHWMCTYIDALCARSMDSKHERRLTELCDKASGYWYKVLPGSMHTLLVHAMLHLKDQALLYGPQCMYWLFHKERSARTAWHCVSARLLFSPLTPHRSPPSAGCTSRYIGFLTRCALSKPHPELSIINTVNSMARCVGRIPVELAEEVFGDGGQPASQLAYAGMASTRPQQLRSMPFQVKHPPHRHRSGEPLMRQRQVNSALRRQLLEPREPREEKEYQPLVAARIQAILRRLDSRWSLSSSGFSCGVSLHGAYRDKEYEKPWDASPQGFLHPTADWSTNRHVFACAWTADSMTPVDRSMLSLLSHTSSRRALPTTVESTQRAPFERDEAIAYGLVKRWIVLGQKMPPAASGAARELSAIIAHVRIFEWEVEEDTGCPIVRQCSRDGYDDHYMLANHIVCRITLSPLPADQQRYLVSHVL